MKTFTNMDKDKIINKAVNSLIDGEDVFDNEKKYTDTFFIMVNKQLNKKNKKLKLKTELKYTDSEMIDFHYIGYYETADNIVFNFGTDNRIK